MKKLIFTPFLACVLVSRVFAADVSHFDIAGIRLGMSLEEVKSICPTMEVEEYRHIEFRKDSVKNIFHCDIVEGYEGNCRKTSRHVIKVYFTTKELGKKVFEIWYVRRNISGLSEDEVFQKLKEKYGPPKGTRSVHNERFFACWGLCDPNDGHEGVEYGTTSGKFLDARIEIKRRGYMDLNLQLRDNDQAFLNRKNFEKKKAQSGSEEAKQRWRQLDF